MTRQPITRLKMKQVKRPPSKSSRDKAEKKRLEKQLDDLWSQIVKKTWGNKCGWPGCEYTTSIAAHHYFHKAQGNIARWELDNGIALDFYHHIQVVHRQGNTEPIRDAIIQRIGQKNFDDLKQNVVKSWKPTVDELREVKWNLEALLLKEF